ncbi:MAG: IS200/IS605 family transposase [Deltaproteobacteria bacterium]|nr:IS200/IS605 family transposase [Deltaproteobacteria bacterium]
MEIRKQAHCVYRCMYHMVWIPRYRHKVLVKGVDKYLLKKMDEIRKVYPEIEYVQRNIQPDHVHIVLSFPPRYSIAKVVQIIKSNTGKAMREKFDFLRKRYYGRGGIWSAGYFVSTVGLDEKLIERYVRYQEKEDLGQAKLALD